MPETGIWQRAHPLGGREVLVAADQRGEQDLALVWESNEPALVFLHLGPQRIPFYARPGHQYSLVQVAKGWTVRSEDDPLHGWLADALSDLRYLQMSVPTTQKQAAFKALLSRWEAKTVADPFAAQTLRYVLLGAAAADERLRPALQSLIWAALLGPHTASTHPEYWNLLTAYLHEQHWDEPMEELALNESAGEVQTQALKRLGQIARQDIANDTLRDLAMLHAAYLCYTYVWEDLPEIHFELNRLARQGRTASIRQTAALLIGQWQRIRPGDQVPEMMFWDAAGKARRTTEWRGKYVLIDFWATWCAPCLREMREFPELLRRYGDQLLIVSICTDDEYLKMTEFVRESDYDWSFWYNGLDRQVTDLFGVYDYPCYFLVGPDGKVLQRLEDKPKNVLRKIIR